MLINHHLQRSHKSIRQNKRAIFVIPHPTRYSPRTFPFLHPDAFDAFPAYPMADVTCLRHREPDDDHPLPDHTLTLDPLPYWSHADFDFDFYPSDPEFPPPDSVLRPLNASRDSGSSHQFESAISVRGDDNFSDPGSIPSSDLLDRENQVNFVMDLFQQRVEQSQVMGHSDLVSEVLDNSDFGIIDGHCDVGVDALGMDFELGLGFGVDRDSLPGDDNSGFIFENYGSGGGGDGDQFFVGRRVPRSESVGTPSTAGRIRPFENFIRLMEFGSDSDDENGALGVCAHSEDEYNVHDENDDVASIPLCWDSLQLDDNRENAEDFEWEEVDGRVDERDVLSMLTGEDDASVSVSVSPINVLEEEASVMRAGGVENLGWEVLLTANNLDTNPDLDHDTEPYFGDHDDYIYTAEYEMMFGQFADSENPLVGRPPASVSVVQNLPSVIVTKQHIENNGALCAVCKDEFNVEEQARQLPCSHFYHGECIVPWLGIRNTCPVCRYELPTNDANYERMRVQISGRS